MIVASLYLMQGVITNQCK